MGLMYAWATPSYLLDEMTLEQIMLYFQKGWEGKRSGAIIYWGVLGQALKGKDPGNGIQGLEEFKKSHPDGIIENGVWRVSR